MRLFLHKLCSIANVCKVFKLDKQLIWIGYTNIIALALWLVQLYLYNQFIFMVYQYLKVSKENASICQLVKHWTLKPVIISFFASVNASDGKYVTRTDCQGGGGGAGGGVMFSANLLFGQISPKTAWNWRKLGREGGGMCVQHFTV